jgi:ferredoxin-NADP reductase
VTDASAAAVQPIPWQTADVVEIVTQTPRIKSFFLTLAQPFDFAAGQHVDVRLTAPDGYRAMRSYSIASPPDDRTRLELAIELLDDGEVSPFFHDVVAVGDTIELRGPLGGYFLWPPGEAGPLLLIGGGSGLVPLMAMLRHRRAAGLAMPVVLLLSSRTWDDILYRDELLALDAHRDGFQLVLTLTRDQPRRPGDFGRRVDAAMVQDVVRRLPAAPNLVFVCGANRFVDAAADGAVATGIPAALVRTERYGA